MPEFVRIRCMAKLGFMLLVPALLSACAGSSSKNGTYDLITAQIKVDLEKNRASGTDAVAQALLPPLTAELPKARQLLEERFNVNFNNVPARQFFAAIVAGTRFNMLLNPEVSGTISANLKDVTLIEALDAVRELYGYDYKIDGTRIYISPLTMQTRMYQVNYLSGSRRGSSNLRVTSTSISGSSAGAAGASSTAGAGTPQGSVSGAQGQDSSGVSTVSSSDFWVELKAALDAIVGKTKEGSSVVISPQSGMVVIRAMPDELRNVSLFLKATQISVDRQVILEAKILEVQLNDASQTGINWAIFKTLNGNPLSLGFVSPSTTLAPKIGGTASLMGNSGDAAITATAGASLGAAVGAAGSLFGLAFQTSNFSTLISFLESQGTVHVLSSPRIATMNNQKAVLKIGTDEFYVTGVSTTTVTSGTASTSSPNVTLQPFFSGVVLDVTPQIDGQGNILLHVHPSVNQVSTVTKGVNLGTAGGSVSLPLASSSTSEMDSIVRGQDGRIVALGGLMKQSSTGSASQVPLAGNIPLLGGLFRNTASATQKSELVVLIKPTIVYEDSGADDLRDVGRRIESLRPPGSKEPR